MPFVALRDDEKPGRVYIGDYEDPRQALAGVSLICPDCRTPVGVRRRRGFRDHFWHLPGSIAPCYWRTHAESPLHMFTKRVLADYLKEYPGVELVEVEYPITTADGKTRYIDVYTEGEDGERYAHEIQLSAQSLDDFAARTNDYRSLGIEAVWWLGGATANNDNRAWCERECVMYGELRVHTYSRRTEEVSFNSRGERVSAQELLIR